MPAALHVPHTSEGQPLYRIGLVHAVELSSIRTRSPPPARDSWPNRCSMLWHGDNSHGCLVLGRAWADTYLIDVIAARHHQRGACRQYLSVVLPNLCNFAQEREEDFLEMGHDRSGQGATRRTSHSSQTDHDRDDQGKITAYPVHSSP